VAAIMQRSRLQKHVRLLKAADFDRVFNKSVRSSDRFFTVLARPNEVNHPRLGLAISKRRARHAVTRNRLKRIIRENFRLSHSNTHADYIVMAGHQGAGATNKELFQSLEKHWEIIKKKCVDF
jgi:ribonuclease P protein component